MEPPGQREDLSRVWRNLPPGTLAGLDSLVDGAFWMSIMRQAEIEVQNEDIFRFRYAPPWKAAQQCDGE